MLFFNTAVCLYHCNWINYMLLSDTAIWLYHDRLNISLFDPYT